MVAFGASEKLRRSLISAPSLHLPDVDFHILAFGALHTHLWHGVDFVVFADGYDLLLKVVFYGFGGAFSFFFLAVSFHVAAFAAAKRDAASSSGGYKPCTAVRTKLHTNH
jgi:hypothetical protein